MAHEIASRTSELVQFKDVMDSATYTDVDPFSFVLCVNIRNVIKPAML